MASQKVIVSQQQPITVKVKPGTGSGADQFARDLANAAFFQANSVAQNAFTSIEVSGQNTVIATSNTSTLTLIASTGILLETDPPNNSVAIVATGGSAFDQFARDRANSAVRTGFISVNANGTFLTPTTNANTLVITGVQANGIAITANTQTETIDIALQPSGVTAGSFGNTNTLLQITVDIFGRILSIANVAPSFNTSVLTEGILSVQRGGTGANSFTNNQILIGNTLSGGLDQKTLQAGTGVSVNVSGNTVSISSSLTLPIQSKSVSYGYPLLNETITLFYTNTAITFQRVQSVVAGITPNIKFNLLYTADRSNTSGTLILANSICDNTTTGIETSSFVNSVIPANNFILLRTTELTGSIEELALTTFFSNS